MKITLKFLAIGIAFAISPSLSMESKLAIQKNSTLMASKLPLPDDILQAIIILIMGEAKNIKDLCEKLKNFSLVSKQFKNQIENNKNIAKFVSDWANNVCSELETINQELLKKFLENKTPDQTWQLLRQKLSTLEKPKDKISCLKKVLSILRNKIKQLIIFCSVEKNANNIAYYRILFYLLLKIKIDTNPRNQTIYNVCEELKHLYFQHPIKDILNAYPLILAVIQSLNQFTKMLLKHDAFIDCCKSDRYTPLMLAADHSNFELVKLLSNYGADLKLTNEDDQTALEIAQIVKMQHDTLFQLNNDEWIKVSPADVKNAHDIVDFLSAKSK